jgi:hypothetical protein
LTDLRAAFERTSQSDSGVKTWVSAVCAWGLTWPDAAHVLEVGSCGADWVGKAQACCPDITITALDWRGPAKGPGRRIKGDVLRYDFQPSEFDVIAFISALEHIGLGHYDHDPVDPDGDAHAFARCAGWLKSGGLLYADVPYDPSHYSVFGSKCRIYDDAAIRGRFTHPQMHLDAQAWTNLRGDLIDKPAALVNPDGGHPFVYCANLWRKE